VTWFDLLTGAIGVLGWTEDQFWSSDPRTLAGAHEARRRQREEDQRQAWERTRWQTAVLLAPHNKGKMIAPGKLIEFPWERDTRPRTRPEDWQKVADGLGRKIKQPQWQEQRNP